ncbi:hypothetical protein Xph01_00450 [Micromonospora phaseoli]|nr:hypothetical protein Xph01_00450 [Micromonospora phaseoli]
MAVSTRVNAAVAPKRCGSTPAWAYLGGQVGGRELDRPPDLSMLQRVWEATLGAALPPQKSIEPLKEIAESWS